MKKIIKKILINLIKSTVSFLHQFKIGRYILEKIDLSINEQNNKIFYKNKKYQFFTPNRVNYFRADTFKKNKGSSFFSCKVR